MGVPLVRCWGGDGVPHETHTYFCHPLLHCTLNFLDVSRDQVMENSGVEAEEGSECCLAQGALGGRQEH